jgi:hypothetical protein
MTHIASVQPPAAKEHHRGCLRRCFPKIEIIPLLAHWVSRSAVLSRIMGKAYWEGSVPEAVPPFDKVTMQAGTM